MGEVGWERSTVGMAGSITPEAVVTHLRLVSPGDDGCWKVWPNAGMEMVG